MQDRRPEHIAIATIRPVPAPLAGRTVLVVEDSRLSCDALRLMCLRSGARIRRADCLRAAWRHLGLYRPDVAIVDMGLPDGSGAELIARLARTLPTSPVIIATSGDPEREREARDAGACAFLPKPLPGLSQFQDTVRAHLDDGTPLLHPCMTPLPGIEADPQALRDDLAHGAHLLATRRDPDTHAYVARFLAGVARSAGDPELEATATALTITPGAASLRRLAAVLNSRLERDALV